MDSLGGWAFLIGVILAVIFGAFGAVTGWIAIALVVIGLLVGFLNITDKEIKPFMYAGAILVIVSYFGGTVMGEITFVKGILDAMMYIFVPATIIVTLKSVFSLARSK